MRSVSAREIYGLWHFIPQQLLIILAPIWLNAFVYMVLGRMIHFLIPEQKIFGVSARRLTLIFVLLDVFSFLIQGSSSSLMSSDNSPHLVRIGINVCKSPPSSFLPSNLFLTLRLRHGRHRRPRTLHPPLHRPRRPLPIPNDPTRSHPGPLLRPLAPSPLHPLRSPNLHNHPHHLPPRRILRRNLQLHSNERSILLLPRGSAYDCRVGCF